MAGSLAHQRKEHDEQQRRCHHSSKKDALWVKVVLLGEAAPVLSCQAVQGLQEVDQTTWDDLCWRAFDSVLKSCSECQLGL